MTEIDWRDIHSRLSSPEGMHVKVRENKFRYIDARQVMDRLDEVVGPQNWHASFRTLSEEAVAVECALTVYGVTKCDAGYPNNPGSDFEKEPFKAAYSDALKRAAVHFGVGRFLYDDAPPPQLKSGAGAGGGHGARPGVQPAQRPTGGGAGVVPRADQPPVSVSPAADGRYECQAQGCGVVIVGMSVNGKEYGAAQVAAASKQKYGRVYCPEHIEIAKRSIVAVEAAG